MWPFPLPILLHSASPGSIPPVALVFLSDSVVTPWFARTVRPFEPRVTPLSLRPRHSSLADGVTLGLLSSSFPHTVACQCDFFFSEPACYLSRMETASSFIEDNNISTKKRRAHDQGWHLLHFFSTKCFLCNERDFKSSEEVSKVVGSAWKPRA